MKKLACLASTVVLVFFATAAPVVAQTSTQSAVATTSATPSATSSPSPSPTPDVMPQLRDLYKNQLEVYRTDQQAYQIARQQYYQLQTLISLEEAVKTTRKVMLSRTEVLYTYLQMLRLTLQQTQGIEFGLKQNQINKLTQLLIDFKQHHVEVDSAVDRSSITKTVADFVALQKRFQDVSFQTLTLISYGRVQSVYDKTVSVESEIKQHVEQNETDALRLSEKQRAFVQIENTFTYTSSLLKQVLTNLEANLNPQKGQQYFGGGLEVSDNLSKAYGGVSRSLSFLQEVLNI